MQIKRTGQLTIVPYTAKFKAKLLAQTAEGRRVYQRTVPVVVKASVNKRIERRWVS